MSGPVVVLAGGTGGAKLARGMLDVVGAKDLVVIANTADDIEIYGAHVSPDPDLVTFWLADQIDERGWGLRGDSFNVMDGLRQLGLEVWFNLGDRDLAFGLHRAWALQHGGRLTTAQVEIARALGVEAPVLPMSDDPVRTQVMAGGGWLPFQEFMIKSHAEPSPTAVEFRGARAAMATPEVLTALHGADAIVIGPSNPIISVAPILAVAGIRGALVSGPAPVVAVSPLVHGQVRKGPTAAFMAMAGRALSSTGVADCYENVIDGLVADEPTERVPVAVREVVLDDPAARRAVAAATLEFALSLPRKSANG